MFQFYDDELHNLILVADKNLKEIIVYTSIYDFHPPVQYILNKFFLELFGLNEFWLSLPSVFFTLLTVIISGNLVYKITKSFSWSAASGIIMLLHPLVFLWGKSVRWYPFWTFLTLLSVYLFISLWNNDTKRKWLIKLTSLIIITAISLYTNYQTILLMIATILTALILDKKEQTWNRTKQTLIVVTGTLILFVPYITTFISHAKNFLVRKGIYDEYIGTSPVISGSYFLYSVLFGQSLFPWNCSFIIFFVTCLIALIGGIIFYFKERQENINEIDSIPNHKHFFLSNNLVKTVFYLTVILFVLSLLYSFLAGINISRGFMVLPILLIIISVSFGHHLFKKSKIKGKTNKTIYWASIFAVSILILWMIGSYNVITRKHLHKSGLIIPVNEITGIIKSYEKENRDNITVITTDFVLSYYLMKDTQLHILSPYSKELEILPGIKNETSLGDHNQIIFIRSYPGALTPLNTELNNYKDYLFGKGQIRSEPINIAYDSDYEFKDKFFPASGIEKWRYRIFMLTPKISWDVNFLKKISNFRVH